MNPPSDRRIQPNIPLDGPRIWQTVLDQLQMEMEKSTFDMWVQHTVFLSYSPEDGLFRIGAPNAQVCDWLSDRLLGMAKKLLIGATGIPVNIQFEVQEASSSLEELGPSALSNPENSSGKIRFDTIYSSITDEVLKPDTILTIPQYLWRLSPLLGPTSTCRYIGIRQIQYFRGLMDREGVFHATLNELAGFSGMGRATWQKGPSSKIESWLFHCVSKNVNNERGQGGKIVHRSPRQYSVCGTLPLSPADQQFVWGFLKDCGVLRDPVSALRQAIQKVEESSRYSLFAPNDQLVLSDPISPPQTIEQLVISSCRVNDKNIDLIRDLAHTLQRNLVGGWDCVPHYFVRRVGPKLEYPAMLLVIWLHYRANHKSRSDSDEFPDSNLVYIRGGFKEIGLSIGINPSTIRDWFNSKHLNNLLPHYASIERVDKQSNQAVSLLFKVQLSDRNCPLLPEDEHMVNKRFRDNLLGPTGNGS
jgi:hypothetical protein